MKRELWLVLGITVMLNVAYLTGASQNASGEVLFLGTYSHFRETPEHAYGYALELWRDGTVLVGRWSRAKGEEGDFPTVVTTALQWDEANGALSFTAKWCNEVESFKGTLRGEKIEGTLNVTLAGGRSRATHLVLMRNGDDFLHNMPRAEWKARLDAMQKRLGPRCSD